MGILEENIGILRDHYPPLAGIPEAQLRRLIRTYELDPGDSVTFNNNQEECVFVLSGEVVREGGDEAIFLDPHNTLSRPVCLAADPFRPANSWQYRHSIYACRRLRSSEAPAKVRWQPSQSVGGCARSPAGLTSRGLAFLPVPGPVSG